MTPATQRSRTPNEGNDTVFATRTTGWPRTWRTWCCRAAPTCRATATTGEHDLRQYRQQHHQRRRRRRHHYGGAGNDTYFVDDAGDMVVENPNEGTDAVFSTVSYTLTANVETLVLQGSGQLQGNGNASPTRCSAIPATTGSTAARHRHAHRQRRQRHLRVHLGKATATPSSTSPATARRRGIASFRRLRRRRDFTKIDPTHWQVNYNGGASHDVITFTNAAAIDPSDYSFAESLNWAPGEE